MWSTFLGPAESSRLTGRSGDRFDQTVSNFEAELELSGLENDSEQSISTMTAAPPNDNQQKTEQYKIICITVRNLATTVEIVIKG